MSSLPKFLRKAEEEVPGSGGPGKMNREAWLNELAKLAVPVFSGYQLKPYRLTGGWVSATAWRAVRGESTRSLLAP
jgi:hypothetical protein